MMSWFLFFCFGFNKQTSFHLSGRKVFPTDSKLPSLILTALCVLWNLAYFEKYIMNIASFSHQTIYAAWLLTFAGDFLDMLCAVASSSPVLGCWVLWVWGDPALCCLCPASTAHSDLAAGSAQTHPWRSSPCLYDKNTKRQRGESWMHQKG